MDEVTLVGAGLIGAGIATLGLALFVVGRCGAARGRTRRPPAPRPSRPRPAPARPTPAHPRPEEAGRPRPAPDPAPRRRPPVPTPMPPVPTPMAEALDGETLLLGPVPAWRLPVSQRIPTAVALDAPRAVPADEAPTLPGVTAGAVPTRGETVRFSYAGPRPPAEDGPPRPDAGPDVPAGAEPARFGWFGPGR